MDGRPLPGSAAPLHHALSRVVSRRGSLGFCAALAATLFLLLPAAAVAATPGAVVWSQTWNASGTATVSGVQAAEAPNGGLYVATTVRRNGDRDIALLRFSAAGKRLWTRWYDGPASGADTVAGIASGPGGSVIVCGSTAVTGAGADWVVLRYASGGKRLWSKRLGGSAGRTDGAVDVAVDASGNAVVTGMVTRTGTGVDWCTAKYAPNGFRRWRAWISTVGVGEDRPSALALAGTGRIVVVGQFWSKTRAEDAVVASYSDKGRLIWRRVWQGLGPSRDLLNAVAVGPAGIAAVGETHGALGGGDGLVLSYSAGGALRWNVVADGGAEPAGPDRFATVALTSRGGVIAGGSATMSSASGDDAVVARFAADDGAQTAWWPWDAGADDAVVDLRLTGGEVFAAGRSGASGGSQALLAGLSADLVQLWPPLAIAGAEARRVVPVEAGVFVAGTRADDLLVAKVAR